VQALAHQVQGNTSQALALLRRALALAEPEGYVRIFVDEGAPLARLLQEAAGRGIAPEYAGRILSAFPNTAVSPATQSKTPAPRPNMVVPPMVEPEMVEPLVESLVEPLVEPLSPRELEILQLIAQGLSNHAICERLFLALSTVKGYNQRIFEKLQVQSRTEAVARARELGLL
jgi:LuxR family transcriptional regulator, maltose regulon positive regulatory protein